MFQLTGKKRAAADYLMIIIGTGLMAVASVLFYDPCGMVPGGFTGAAIIIKEVSSKFIDGGIPLWMTNMAFNIPLIPITIHLKGWKFVQRTVFAFLSFSAWLAVIPEISISIDGDLFLVSVFGGLVMGGGIALVFLAKATTGGTDLCGAILQRFLPHVSIPKLMQALDAVIICAGIMTFGFRMSLYSIITTYLCAVVSDRMMDGLKFSKMAYIISNQADAIAERILVDMARGVTGLNGRGMYTGQAKNVLLCVVPPKEIVKIKEIVHSIDQNAFVIVSDSREVLGEGFVEYHQ
ncbi:MAG: YitT family protein [Lachnospiraceae bacterium]|nr:YitT family protein [Lachnospiraceae bacterium]